VNIGAGIQKLTWGDLQTHRQTDNMEIVQAYFFFEIGIAVGGIQSGPLGTAATNRHIVPAPGDYEDGDIGGMIGRGNRGTRV
jgi:hypothetical protein